MAISLVISDEKLQEVFEGHLNSLLEKGVYDNPVRRAFDDLMGYKGALREEFNEKVKGITLSLLDTPKFHEMLGKAIAEEMAKRQVDLLEKKFKDTLR